MEHSFLDSFDYDEDEGDSDREEQGENTDTVTCPHCQRAVYEQAEVCPYCDEYFLAEDTTKRKPLWIILGVAVCLVIVILLWIL
jgi:hypothetical protein